MSATASARIRVPLTRLPRIRAFFRAVHLPCATLSPARCTTACTPSSDAGSSSPLSGSHRCSLEAAGGRLTRRITTSPRVSRALTRLVPMRPVEPVTSSRKAELPIQDVWSNAIITVDRVEYSIGRSASKRLACPFSPYSRYRILSSGNGPRGSVPSTPRLYALPMTWSTRCERLAASAWQRIRSES